MKVFHRCKNARCGRRWSTVRSIVSRFVRMNIAESIIIAAVGRQKRLQEEECDFKFVLHFVEHFFVLLNAVTRKQRQFSSTFLCACGCVLPTVSALHFTIDWFFYETLWARYCRDLLMRVCKCNRTHVHNPDNERTDTTDDNMISDLLVRLVVCPVSVPCSPC